MKRIKWNIKIEYCAHNMINIVCPLFPAGPDDCDFEDEPRFTCHWHNASGYILQWVRNTGSTPSRNTGPNGDATDGLNGSM